MRNGLNLLFNLIKRFIFTLILLFVIFSNLNIAKAVDPVSGSVNVNGSVVYVPTKLVFLSSPQIVERGQYSTQFTVEIQNEAGYPVPLTSDEDVYLATTSATGEFHNNNTDLGYGPEAIVNHVTIHAGSSTATFYYRDSVAGNYNISISHIGWQSATQPIVIQDTTPPNPPLIISPASGETLASHQVTFTGTADVGTTVLITLEGITYSTSVDGMGHWSFLWPNDLTNNSYTASAITRDEYGNDSLPTTVLFNINVPVPTPTPTPTVSPTVSPTPQPSGPLVVDVTVDNMTVTYNNSQTEIVKSVLINTDMTLVAKPSLPKPVKTVEGYFNGIKYEFIDANGDGKYEKQVTTPMVSGQYNLKVVVTYEDGQVEELDMIVLVDPFGYVYELSGDAQLRMRGVVVVLWVYLDGKWQIWKAEPYNQINPQLTADNGEYGFIVPEGLYYLTAEKEGYEFYKSHTMFVSEGNPVNINIKMTKIGFAGVVGDITQLFKDIAANADIYLSPFVYGNVAQNTYLPINISTIISIVLSGVILQVMNVSLLAPFASLLARLLALFGIIPRRKKSWGIVYDSENEKPVPMAVVQIFDREFGKLLETQITDKDGRFGFVVAPGEYYIKASKAEYAFPSKLSEDDYHGEVIKVSEKIMLTLNIPIDPDMRTLAKKIIRTSTIYRIVNAFRLLLLVVGTFYSFSFAVVHYDTLNMLIFGLYVLAWIHEIYVRSISAKAFSTVYDVADHNGVGLGIVRVFRDDGKIIATKVSDNAGNFAFLVEKGDYHLTITNPDYEQFRSENLHFDSGDVLKKKFGLKPRISSE